MNTILVLFIISAFTGEPLTHEKLADFDSPQACLDAQAIRGAQNPENGLVKFYDCEIEKKEPAQSAER